MARRNFRIELNTIMPAFRGMKFGTWIEGLVTQVNAILTAHSALRSGILSSGALAINAGGAAFPKAATAFAALANGVLITVAANTAMAALVGTLATAKTAAWAFYVDSTGTITTSAKTADAANAAAAVALLQPPPAGKAMIGFITVGNATGAPFVGGTTALDAASVTTAYFNTVGSVLFAASDTGVATLLPSAIVSDQA